MEKKTKLPLSGRHEDVDSGLGSTHSPPWPILVFSSCTSVQFELLKKKNGLFLNLCSPRLFASVERLISRFFKATVKRVSATFGMMKKKYIYAYTIGKAPILE